MASHLDVRRGLCLVAALVLPTLLTACDGGPPPPMVLNPPPEETPGDVIPIAGDSSGPIDETDADWTPPPKPLPPVNPQLQIMKPSLPGG